jgi:hypothetical protein
VLVVCRWHRRWQCVLTVGALVVVMGIVRVWDVEIAVQDG